MWQRWNQSTHIFEKSDNDGASWTPLPLNASSFTEGNLDRARLPPLVAMTDLQNTFSALQIVDQLTVKGAFSILNFYTTNAGVDAKKSRLLCYGDGALRWEIFSDTDVFQGTPFYITRGGYMTLAGATLLGGILAFPVTQIPSPDSNHLDDYEEGTWTCLDISGAGLTFSIPSAGSYVKIGQMVIASFGIGFPATSDTRQASINLPFPSHASAQWGGFAHYTNAGFTPMFLISGSGCYFYANNGGLYTNAAMSGKDVRGTLVYRTSQ